MSRNLLCVVFLAFSAIPAFSWTNGQLLVWVSADKGWRGFAELAKKFEAELGIPVKVETPDGLTDKFQSAAQSGEGPDIAVWAHDRIGEWADAGLLKPLDIKEEFKAAFFPMTWEAVTHNKQIWGYPIAIEAVSLIYNKKLISDNPPDQLLKVPEFAKQLKAKHPGVLPIMWDYPVPYFTWPFLASAGGYVFKKAEGGYDIKNVGVNDPGAVQGLQEVVNLIKADILPKGSTYSITEQKMCSGELALMVSGPWAWLELRKHGVDFGLAPLPGVEGHPGRPFVGVLSALINRSSPNGDLAAQFMEEYVCTEEGLKTIDEDVAIAVPALKTLTEKMSAQDPLVKATFENAMNGILMPNIPEMGKFWGAIAAAIQLATSGRATPQVALDDAAARMKK